MWRIFERKYREKHVFLLYNLSKGVIVMKTKEELNNIIKESKINELSKINTSKAFGETLARLRTIADLTQNDMAVILGISKNTLGRIEAGETEKVDFNVALKASALFHMPIREMCGFLTEDLELYYGLMHATKRTQRLIASIIEVDVKAKEKLEGFLADEESLIDCMKPVNDIRDGIPCNRFYYETENISRYRSYSWFESADALLEINSNAYHPLYHIGDRLVISCLPPRDGDIGVFIRDSCFYLRKYTVCGNDVVLNYVSLEENEKNEYFRVSRHKIEDMNRWVKFGTVLAVI